MAGVRTSTVLDHRGRPHSLEGLSRAEAADLRRAIVAGAWNAGLDLADISQRLLGRAHANGAAPILSDCRRRGMIDADARKAARAGR